ncbi:class I SAM-dependent methyltransferase [Halostella sp. JP-L12]|uniref:class I SAM-dependent methyltransferase n=1 Tax=Halostella TaxID=1843185 RepID=UPI000EF79EF3|nr:MULTISPECIES: class I SAM-dependent methyltransferase [Halostella]NHN47492.1 class I SAM-dependent methyltransferase [Halostella sp. JP-L12]
MVDSDHGYHGERVRFYDAQMAAANRDDAAFYVDRALGAEGPALELACGTGRVYLDQLRAGVDADGLDASADALALLREKAAEEGLDPTVWEADMSEFRVDREYGLVYCPFNAVQHLRTVEEQTTALRRIHEALAPGGEFVFDVFVPGFDVICEEYGEWREERTEFRGEDHEYRTRTRVVDEVEQEILVENELYAPERDGEDGGERVFAESHRLKLLPKREVELLVRASPFETWEVAGGFDGAPLSDGDTTQVWTLRKADA